MPSANYKLIINVYLMEVMKHGIHGNTETYSKDFGSKLK